MILKVAESKIPTRLSSKIFIVKRKERIIKARLHSSNELAMSKNA